MSKVLSDSEIFVAIYPTRVNHRKFVARRYSRGIAALVITLIFPSPYQDPTMSPNKSIYTFEPSSNNSSPASQSFAGSRDTDLVQTDEEFVDQQLFFVTSYSDFDKLAHGPRGHGAKHTLRVYKFQTDGSLILLHISGERSQVINPAFSRFHPR